MNNQWTQQYRQLLNEILDQIIPANAEKGIPSAGVFGVGEFVTLQVADDAHAFTALDTLLTHAVEIDSSVNPDMVRQLEERSAESFALLVKLTYMGYYSRPEIRSLIGIANWPVHPKGYEVPIESPQLMEQLTAPVRARGPLYRETTNTQKAQTK